MSCLEGKQRGGGASGANAVMLEAHTSSATCMSHHMQDNCLLSVMTLCAIIKQLLKAVAVFVKGEMKQGMK